MARPGDDERDTNAGVVEAPFGEWQCGSVIGSINKNCIAGDFFADEGANFAEEAAMLAERRMPLYRALADATVSTAAGTPDALAAIERALDA